MNKLSLNKIKLIVYDFDGVLTDNRVIVNEDGMESVIVNRSDGLAIGIIKEMGIPQIILTTEKNNVAKVRARKLGIPVLKGVNDKKKALVDFCKKGAIPLAKVIYIGNDLNDLEIMKIVGYPICPLDACRDIKSTSKIIIPVSGGSGVVRALIDILKNKHSKEV